MGRSNYRKFYLLLSLTTLFCTLSSSEFATFFFSKTISPTKTKSSGEIVGGVILSLDSVDSKTQLFASSVIQLFRSD